MEKKIGSTAERATNRVVIAESRMRVRSPEDNEALDVGMVGFPDGSSCKLERTETPWAGQTSRTANARRMKVVPVEGIRKGISMMQLL